MRIVICGSMNFAQKMVSLKKKLEKIRDKVFISPLAKDYISGKRKKGSEKLSAKREIDALKLYFSEIKKSEAIIISIKILMVLLVGIL